MKNKCLFCVIFFLLSTFTPVSAEVVDLGKGLTGVNATVEQSDQMRTVVRFELGSFEKTAVETDRGAYYKISCNLEELLTNKGEPELPQLRRNIIIPDDKEVEIRVLSSEYRDFQGVPVVPSKGLLPICVDPETIPYTFGPVYESDSWYPSKLAELTEPFILRDYRGTTIKLSAFQYNPQTQTLRIYKDVKVEITNTGTSKNNVLERREKPRAKVREFEKIYENQFINYSFRETKGDYLEESGDMLVITHPNFYDAMLPFVEWKRQKGIKTSIVDVSTIHNDTTSIKNFIHAFYDTTNLAWVLLVGDVNFVATPYAEFSGLWGSDTGPADPVYSFPAGDDDWPDIFVGRFSAENVSHVQTQVKRSIEYERDHPNAGTGWFSKGACVAMEDMGFIPEMEEVAGLLEGFTYTYIDRIFVPAASGGPTGAMLSSALNEGRSIVSCAMHGDTNSWGYWGFYFSSDSVDELHNINMLPFIFSTACLVGKMDYDGGPCFAEHWLRATDRVTDQPTGAIAAYMASTLSSWAYNDRMARLLVNDGLSTIGGLCFNSLLAVGGLFEIMNIFGDPSLQLCTNTPQELTVNHTGILDASQTHYEVEVEGVEGALCALYQGGVLFGSAYTDASGMATIPIEGLLPEDSLILTVTAFNKATHIDKVAISNFPPYGLHVKICTQNSVTLAWTPKAPWNSLGYNIYRSTISGQPGVRINSDLIAQPESIYTDLGLPLGQTFYYTITNVDLAYQESYPSVEVKITVGYPSPPTALVAEEESTVVSLSWKPNPLQENVVKYKIYHNKTLVDSVSGYVTRYVDLSPKVEGWHFYQVSAANFMGEGLPSDSVPVNITHPSPLISPYDPKISSWNGTSVTLSWKVRQEGDGCNIYRSKVPGVYSKLPLNKSPIDDPLGVEITYQDMGLTEGLTYYYVVTQIEQSPAHLPERPKETPPSNEAQFLAGRPQTPNLRVKSSRKNIRLLISSFDKDIRGYKIFRKEDSGAFQVLDSLGLGSDNPPFASLDTSYVDCSATAGIDYYYQVTAIDKLNLESFPSDSVEGCIMTFDKGLVVVDLTMGGKDHDDVRTGVNSDSVNAFYQRALKAVSQEYPYSHPYTYLDFGNSDDGRYLTLLNLSSHPVAIVHSEDKEISQSLSQATYKVLRQYLEAGGTLLIEGRKNLSGREGFSEFRDFASGDFRYDQLNVDSACLPPSLPPEGFGAREFIGANRTSQAAGYPQVQLDTFRVNYPRDVGSPQKSDDFEGKLAGVGYFMPLDSSEVIYTFVSADSATSASHGKPVALQHITDEYKVIYFDFPLWFVKEDIAIRILTQALGELYKPTSLDLEQESDRAEVPLSFSLSQNSPNPFNSETAIEYSMPEVSQVRIDIYNILGQKVKTLVDQKQSAGHTRVVWDGKNQNGDALSSGTYFYRIQTERFVQIKKMLLLK